MRNGIAVMAIVLAGALATAGCLETETTLAPPEQGVVDIKFVGDWQLKDGDKSFDVIVRNFDGHQLYVELHNPDKASDRYAAQVTALKGGSFAQLRPLTDDGSIERKYVIMRVDRSGDDKINLRHLKEEFFNDKPHETSEKLRAVLEANIDNAAMYEGEAFPITRKAE